MRGSDEQTSHMFSYVVPQQRVRADHPLWAVRRLTDEVLATLSPRFDRMYWDMGRPSIPPEQLLRALLLQSLYTIRSERLLVLRRDQILLIEVENHPELTGRYLVQDDGTLILPTAGRISVGQEADFSV